MTHPLLTVLRTAAFQLFGLLGLSALAAAQAPTAEFSGTPRAGVAPLSVSFTDFSTGTVSAWSWNFGDAGSSTTQNPSHTYTVAGTYTVSLTVNGSSGSDVETKAAYVVVSPAAPVTDFTGTPLSGTAPLTVNFTDLTTGSVNLWAWNFGDLGSSPLQNPSHTYTSPGVYAVSLTTGGPGGVDTETKTAYVTVNVPPPVSEFSATPLSGIAPLTVQFTSLASGAVSGLFWDFGDSFSSTTQSPAHVYASPGTYTVSLAVTGPGGVDIETKTGYIVVAEPPPVADFTGSPTTGIAPLNVSFSDMSSGGSATSWSWTFGDGGVSTLQNPAHVYGAAGTYTVGLTTTGPGGSDGQTKIGYVVVSEPPPVALFSGTPLTGVAPLTVNFADLSTGMVNGWSWSFGDLGTSAMQNPAHTYTQSGVYAVTLVASGPGGSDTETKPAYVTVLEPPPVARFSGSPTSGLAPLTVTFEDFSDGAVNSWSWIFGDGGTSSLQDPTHVYAAAGTYTVSLTVMSPGGADTETKVNYVTVSEQPPLAEFSGTPLSGVGSLTTNFTSLSTGAITSYSWNFGDKGTSTLPNPSHAYGAPGTYTVSLTVSGTTGIDTETKVDYVVVAELPPVAQFSGSPTSGISPLSVTFTDLSSGAVTSWAWTFGDLGTSSAQNPMHTYAAAGTYTVSLTATGPGGSDGETKVSYIVVAEPPPVAAFSGSPLSGVAPLAVTFADLTSGPVTGWSWTFGDGGTSALQNPMHTYAAAGTYTVVLTATGPGGMDTETKFDYVVVAQPVPVANFTGAPLSGVSPLTVSFTDLSTGVVLGWSWAFGDGGTSTQRHPNHTYSAAGTYTVSLVATGPGGQDTETKVSYVVVNEPSPVAEFSSTPRVGVAPLTVNFSDFSLGAVNAWSWTFGDGGTSSLENPSHTYTTAGTYTVSLNVTSPGGADTETKVGYIVVFEPAPVAEFSGSPLSGSSPLSVNFADASSGNVTSWFWDFGDLGTSTLQNPNHIYSGTGAYTVSLTVMGPGGIDTETKAGYILVGNPPPVAGFSGTPVSGVRPLGVSFSDATTGLVTSWSWTFGDGGTSSLQNPTHTYTVAGTYTVALDATGPGGSDTETKVAYVVVAEQPPTAEFAATPLSGVRPLAVNFVDLTSGVVSSWAWNFGDGGTSTLQNPMHTFTAAGTYTVSLTSTGSGGSDVETKAAYITVAEQAPVAAFTGTPLVGVAPLLVSFTDQSTNPVTAWSWDFGDGGTSTLKNPSYVFSSGGVFTVSLTVTGPGGVDILTKVNYVSVSEPPPVANFSGTPLTGTAPLNVAFTDLSSGAVNTWSWSFGDGGTSSLQNPTHTYAALGNYTVSLTVISAGGADTETKLAYVSVTNEPAPVADFTGAPLSGFKPLTVNFTDLTTGMVNSRLWSFGDGGTSTATNPSHTYNVAGTYTVSLSATGPGGTNVNTKVGYVTVSPNAQTANAPTGTVSPPDKADFYGFPRVGTAPLTVQFTNVTRGDWNRNMWDFGDGTGTGTDHPTHVYSSPGTYSVFLEVRRMGGAETDTEFKVGYIVVAAPLLAMEGGSFEEGQGPSGLLPWSVISGSHLVHPAGVARDNDMPTHGDRWVEVSAAGTAGALAPSNPGGEGREPLGAAGIVQSFRFDPTRPHLAFDAAFVLAGDVASAAANDFTSVDVSDGTTTHNLFYADSFSEFPVTSARYGLPMTAATSLAVDLSQLFPDAAVGTTLTLALRAGNGGAGEVASLGYFDHFRLVAGARSIPRFGTGINPEVYAAGAPVLGEAWSATVDASRVPGTVFTAIVAHEGAPASTMIVPGGELLVDLASPFVFQTTVLSGGGLDLHESALPADPSMVGRVVRSQAVLVGPSGPILGNAVDLIVGLGARTKAAQAPVQRPSLR